MTPLTLPIRMPIIIHGKDSLENLKIFNENRILIITDKFGKLLAGERLKKIFAGREILFFDEVEPNPTDTLITRAGNLAKAFKPDMILGIGGDRSLIQQRASISSTASRLLS